MNKELKEAVNKLDSSFESFCHLNKERFSNLEVKGSAFLASELEIKNINKEICRISKEGAALNRRLDMIETANSRTPVEGIKSNDIEATKLFAMERKSVTGGEMDVSEYRAYKKAFTNYLRKNNAGCDMEEQKSLSVGSDPDGGYAVTPDMSGRIASLVYETSPLRQVANVAIIGTDALEGFNDLTEATSGWVGEIDTRNETGSPRIGEWRIPVHEQYAEPRATQKLLDDALFDIEGYLATKIAERLTRMENAAFINGDGIKKPRGILTYPDGVPSSDNFSVIEQIPSGADGDFAAENAGDVLINLVYSLKAPYRENAVFMMNRDTLAAVRKLKDSNGSYLWQPDFQQKHGGTLLGFQVIEAEDMPAIGEDSLSIAFGDFNAAYQIVDRQGVRVLRDSFTAKPYVKFYTTKRVGGDVINFEAIKLMRFSAE